jgi:hypothetical protein
LPDPAAPASYGARMHRASLGPLSTPFSLLLSLLVALAAACSSSAKPSNTIPSDMLGPTGAGGPTGASANASAATVEPAPAAAPSDAGAAPDSSAGSPPPPPASLTTAEQATLGEMQAIMKDVTTQFELLVSALERAGGDCKKAATALSASATASVNLEQKMTSFRDKLSRGGQPSPALMAQLREATLAAFPVDTRARADVTFDALDKKCANDAEFQRAKAAAAPPQ